MKVQSKLGIDEIVDKWVDESSRHGQKVDGQIHVLNVLILHNSFKYIFNIEKIFGECTTLPGMRNVMMKYVW